MWCRRTLKRYAGSGLSETRLPRRDPPGHSLVSWMHRSTFCTRANIRGLSASHNFRGAVTIAPSADMASAVSGRDFGLGILVGAVAAILVASLVFVLVLRSTDIYSLGHWKLNLQTPLESMWMNLGYWYETGH